MIESFINIILNLVQNSTEYWIEIKGNSQECDLKSRLKNQISLQYKSYQILLWLMVELWILSVYWFCDGRIYTTQATTP